MNTRPIDPNTLARLIGVWPVAPDQLFDDLVAEYGYAHADRLWNDAWDLRDAGFPTLPKTTSGETR